MENRVALSVGVKNYPFGALANPVHDAQDINMTLGKLGFAASVLTDCTLEVLDRAIQHFAGTLAPLSVAVFYFAGHGFEVRGENYLAPIDIRRDDEISAKHSAYPLRILLERLDAAESHMNIVILDACRDNPFRGIRGIRTGFAISEGARDTIIAYSCGLGQTANDNPTERNGLFTKYLLEALCIPGDDITDVFRAATRATREASAGRQTPWTLSNLSTKFCMHVLPPTLVVPRQPTLTIAVDVRAVNPLVADDLSVVSRGEQAIESVKVTNGNEEAHDVRVSLKVPLDSGGQPRLRYLDSRCIGFPSIKAIHLSDKHEVVWSAPRVPPDTTLHFEARFEARAIGPAVAVASVIAPGFGGAQDDSRAFVLGDAIVDLAIGGRTSQGPVSSHIPNQTDLSYVIDIANAGEADLMSSVFLRFSPELRLDTSKVAGFIRDFDDTAPPQGPNVLGIRRTVGERVQLQAFNLAPHERRWLSIPVRAEKPTGTVPAIVSVDLDWNLWFEGRLFPRKGVCRAESKIHIDPVP